MDLLLLGSSLISIQPVQGYIFSDSRSGAPVTRTTRANMFFMVLIPMSPHHILCVNEKKRKKK